jgi:G3E family GTPase
MIPLAFVTGFLGSGKTTFLEQLVRRHCQRRIEAANLVLLNKTDHHSSAMVEQAEAAIRGIHPAVPIERTSYCRTDVDVFGTRPPVAAHGELAACVDPNYVTFDVPLTAELDLDRLRAAVERVRDEVYRIKGFADVGGRRCRVEYSATQWTCEEIDGDPPPALVFIVRGPCSPAVRELIRALGRDDISRQDNELWSLA